jgi:membrane protein YqaA with SNARE-associated domain
VLIEILQAARRSSRPRGFAYALRHLGVFGLFTLAVLDGTPLPTFGGPDILTAILAATHHTPWYECAAVATLGSVTGAFITFSMARRSGIAWLHRKFRGRRVAKVLAIFEKWGTGALVASTAIPLPFPTSVLFAASGASKYDWRKFVAVVTLCRAFRYSLIAVLADHYGRHFVRIIRHPGHYWGWLLLFIAVITGITAAGILLNRRFAAHAWGMSIKRTVDAPGTTTQRRLKWSVLNRFQSRT